MGELTIDDKYLVTIDAKRIDGKYLFSSLSRKNSIRPNKSFDSNSFREVAADNLFLYNNAVCSKS